MWYECVLVLFEKLVCSSSCKINSVLTKLHFYAMPNPFLLCKSCLGEYNFVLAYITCTFVVGWTWVDSMCIVQ